MPIVSGDVNITVRIDGAGGGAKFVDTSAESLKRLGAEATTLEKKVSELTQRAVAFKEVGLGASSAAQQNAKSAIALIERQTIALQTELAELHKLGAAQGPLGQLRQFELRDLEKKRGQMTLLAATAGDTEGAIKKTAEQATSFSASLAGIKGGIKPLDSVRGTFENLRSNLLGFPLAIAATVSGMVSIIARLAEAGSASEALRVNAEKYAEAIQGAMRDLQELRKRGGETVTDSASPVGAAAGERFDDVTDKVIRLRERLDELRAADAIAKQAGDAASLNVVLGTADERYLDIKRIENEIRDLGELRYDLQRKTADEIGRQADETARLAREGRELADGWAPPPWVASSLNDRLSRSTGAVLAFDLFKGAVPGATGDKPRDYAAIAAAEAEAAARRGRPGDTSAADWWRDKVARLGAANDNGAISLGEFADLERTIGSPFYTGRDSREAILAETQGTKGGKTPEFLLDRKTMGEPIRDFSQALSDALPGMGEFNTALSQIAETWDAWAKGSGSTRDAVIGSLGAIAKAGAAQIKDERLRAGVLSLIMLGLGTAHVLTPGFQAQGYGELAAAGILAGAAIFGSSSGSSRSSGSGGGAGAGTPRPMRLTGETLGQRAVAVTIQNYYGGRSEQEAGADFTRLVRRVDGTGHERGRDAA